MTENSDDINALADSAALCARRARKATTTDAKLDQLAKAIEALALALKALKQK
jgi:hypothetical protein